MYWELGIVQEDGSTITEESFTDLSEAVRALLAHKNESAFIDLWNDKGEMGQILSKNDFKI